MSSAEVFEMDDFRRRDHEERIAQRPPFEPRLDIDGEELYDIDGSRDEYEGFTPEAYHAWLRFAGVDRNGLRIEGDDNGQGS